MLVVIDPTVMLCDSDIDTVCVTVPVGGGVIVSDSVRVRSSLNDFDSDVEGLRPLFVIVIDPDIVPLIDSVSVQLNDCDSEIVCVVVRVRGGVTVGVSDALSV